MDNKHILITKVNRGFIVKFMHGDRQKEAAIYISLNGSEFKEDVDEFFRKTTEEELKEMERKAKEPVK